MAPSVNIVECAPRLIAYVRRQATLRSVPAVAAASPLWTLLFERDIKSTNTPVAVFIDAAGDALFSEDGFLVDLGAEVLEPFEDEPTLHFGQTPSGRAATASFTGPYAEIAPVHRAIRAWCAENGQTLAGPIWEVYQWNDDPALLQTQVYYLLG